MTYNEDKFYMDVMVGSSLEGTMLTLIAQSKIKDTVYVMSKKLINLEKQAIQDALITLGWTPPYKG